MPNSIKEWANVGDQADVAYALYLGRRHVSNGDGMKHGIERLRDAEESDGEEAIDEGGSSFSMSVD